MRFYGDSKLYRIPSTIWIFTDIVVYCLSKMIPVQGILLKVFKYGFANLHSLLGGVMLFVVLAKIAARVNWRKSRVFRFFAARSMTIYLFHE